MWCISQLSDFLILCRDSLGLVQLFIPWWWLGCSIKRQAINAMDARVCTWHIVYKCVERMAALADAGSNIMEGCSRPRTGLIAHWGNRPVGAILLVHRESMQAWFQLSQQIVHQVGKLGSPVLSCCARACCIHTMLSCMRCVCVKWRLQLHLAHTDRIRARSLHSCSKQSRLATMHGLFLPALISASTMKFKHTVWWTHRTLSQDFHAYCYSLKELELFVPYNPHP